MTAKAGPFFQATNSVCQRPDNESPTNGPVPVVEVEFFDLPYFPVQAVQFATLECFGIAQHKNSFFLCDLLLSAAGDRLTRRLRKRWQQDPRGCEPSNYTRVAGSAMGCNPTMDLCFFGFLPGATSFHESHGQSYST